MNLVRLMAELEDYVSNRYPEGGTIDALMAQLRQDIVDDQLTKLRSRQTRDAKRHRKDKDTQ